MVAWRRRILVLAASATFIASGVALARAVEPLFFVKRKNPHAPAAPTVETLAREIDWLERHVDHYGSIVAKHPDIWGESRLTKHRAEFERMMFEQLNQFTATINATQFRSDQAYLQSALAISAAAGGNVSSLNAQSSESKTVDEQKTTEINVLDDVPELLKMLPEDGKITLNNSEMKSVQESRFRGLNADNKGIALEPVVFIDQLKTYLDHLHELRRINEGDDTSDSPGYSLNLVRIPISVLPGKHTQRGYGAEITVTATPVLSDALLPTTFRNLVINDLVDQLGLPVTKISESEVITKVFDDETGKSGDTIGFKSERFLYGPPPEASANADQARIEAAARDEALAQTRAFVTAEVTTATQPVSLSVKSRRARYGLPPTQLVPVYGECTLLAISKEFHKRYSGRDVRWAGSARGSEKTEKRVHLLDVQRFLHAEIDAAYELLKKNQQLMMDFVGPNDEDLAKLIRGGHMQQVCDARNTFFQAIRDTYQPLEPIPDQQARRPNGQVRKGMVRPVAHEALLPSPEAALPPDCRCPPYLDGPNCDPHLTATEALAWAILVECALLNDQLIDDMRRTAESKECHCLDGGPLPYYLPEPPQAASDSFKEYVRCRWPIIVFALNPTALQQNVADAYSRKRELQLTLAVGFASGEVSARNLTRYVRRLETDIETITLNQTIVGFSHGSNTFGWRFFPRVQPPPFQSNATVFFRDLIGGGPTRESDRAQLELETGMRECVAVVLMPSFVPYVDFDTRSNWFCLNQRNGLWPWRSQTEISMADTMKLSRSIKSMHTCAQTVCDGGLYRDGETNRLLRRVEQLDEELPLQTMRAQIPYENTLGGFEMFNTGLTDLAPELAGWYGAPGILVEKGAAPCDPAQVGSGALGAAPADCKCVDGKRPYATPLPICEGKGTTIFLVGDNFSVHDTKVIAGATCIPHFLLISRQLMQVTIPSCVQTVSVDDKDYVAVHVATPYGVTSHLHIPVTRPEPAASAALTEAAARKLVREEFVHLQPATNSELTTDHCIFARYTLKPPGTKLQAAEIDASSTTFVAHVSNRFQDFYRQHYPHCWYEGNLGARVTKLEVAAVVTFADCCRPRNLGTAVPVDCTITGCTATIALKGDSLKKLEEQLASLSGCEACAPKKEVRLKLLLNVPGECKLGEVPIDLSLFCDPCLPKAATPTCPTAAPPTCSPKTAVPTNALPKPGEEASPEQHIDPATGLPRYPLEGSPDGPPAPEIEPNGKAAVGPRLFDGVSNSFDRRADRPLAFTAGMVPQRRLTSNAAPVRNDFAARHEITPLPPVDQEMGSSQRPAVDLRAMVQRGQPSLVLPAAPQPQFAGRPASSGSVRR